MCALVGLSCLRVAFLQELKRHAALEHGGELTKEQKKDALRIEVNFQVRRENEEEMRRFGGGRGGRGGRGGGGDRGEGSGAAQQRGVRHAASVPAGLGEAAAQAHAAAAAAMLSRSGADLAPAAAAAAAAAVAGVGMPSARSVPDLAAAEAIPPQEAFPPLESASRGPTVFGGAAPRWLLAAAAPGSVLQEAQWAAGGGGTADAGPSGAGARALTSEELFPALPTMSKSAAKKQKQKDKAALDAAAAIRASLVGTPQRRADDLDELAAAYSVRPQSAVQRVSSGGSISAQQQQQQPPQRAPEPAPRPSSAQVAAGTGPPPGFPQRLSAASLFGSQPAAQAPAPAQAPPAMRPSGGGISQEAFPALGGGSGGLAGTKGKKSSTGSLVGGSSRNLSSGSFAAAAAPPPAAVRRPPSGAGLTSSGSSSGLADSSANRGPAASAAAAAPEDARAAANRALVQKIRSMLPLVTQDEDFARFRDTSARFRDGTVSADDYLRVVYALGLSAVIPDLCSLLPDPARREELSAAAARAIAREEEARERAAAAARRSAAAVAAARVEDYTEEDNVLAAALNKVSSQKMDRSSRHSHTSVLVLAMKRSGGVIAPSCAGARQWGRQGKEEGPRCGGAHRGCERCASAAEETRRRGRGVVVERHAAAVGAALVGS